ncbi:hypothetical protein Salat_1199300 [Sesamum alatum]|uniref:CCHC-type domain-containing protein n=1 Tax=Sesamum alatum TaxID=300844 RepID=A0AAE1YF89_9LAMI|nr:hypothetical protein Salat_1199300 [Sesamum alatum]
MLLVLKVLEDDDDPASTDLDWADFSIHVSGLSIGRISRSMAEFIGNQLGRFKDVELDSRGQLWGSSLRIRVGLDVTKPLRRILKLHTTMGAEMTLTFTYERLPNFCYWCGQLGHIMKFCECQHEPGFDDKQDPFPFGPWLRATTPALLHSRGVNLISRPSFAGQTPTYVSPVTDSQRDPAIFQYALPPTSPSSQPNLNTRTSMPLNTQYSNPEIAVISHSAATTKTIQNPITPPLLPPLLHSHTQPNITQTLSTALHRPTGPPPLYTSDPIPLPCHPLSQTLVNVPLVFSAASQLALSPFQSSSTLSTHGRRKQAPFKKISIQKKQKLIDETLDASESPSKCVKQVDVELMD